MTRLRKTMLEELERRNYAQTTINCYIQTIEDFPRHFRRRPDQLTPEHIREYQAYLFRERNLAASTVTQRLAVLRFFYTQTIRKAWSVADTPYPKKARPLPSILSPERSGPPEFFGSRGIVELDAAELRPPGYEVHVCVIEPREQEFASCIDHLCLHTAPGLNVGA
ncbi:MAG TPA: site-specific integrase [Candidatus Sulfotelmatobacter sp.]|jgi:hypothetical protein|nr:site-specific integrase [Candidatus Sulfotelmatobacter sp.]